MDNSIIEKYKQEMMRMARSSAGQGGGSASVPTGASLPVEEAEDMLHTEGQTSGEETTLQDGGITTVQARSSGEAPRIAPYSDMGELIAVSTTARDLYPVPYANITVFTGPYDQMDVIAVGKTDESGRSDPFALPAPPRELSQLPGAQQKPYAEYNMLVQADGYADNIHMNIPIFGGVTTRQRSPMLVQTPSSPQKGPFIFKSGEGRDL